MKKAIAVFLPIALVLAACGGDDATGPTTTVPVPSVAGTYSGYWLVQFRRLHDGYSGSFYCNGSMTIAQTANGSLTGFLVVSSSCPPSSFDLTGGVDAQGAIRFTSGGPRPPVGQCPSPTGATYSGVVTDTSLSARASVQLECPGPGEGTHTFDYILQVYKSS
jgi:hypothetical protein